MTEAIPVHDPSELTRFIEIRYHIRHRESLPDLAKMARQVEDLHFGDDSVPEGLSDLLQRMIGEMEAHMKQEELVLFPAIRKAGASDLDTPIAVLRADHERQESDLAEVRRLTGGLAVPDRACRTWAELYAGPTEFMADLEEHMRLENDLLFPQFETTAAQTA
ncbi:hemerythrin domain-containing protein [Marinovum sp.]|uniref:hemerythrin domain-containing protein n=1 Tax=Marinovum sp. TaxID=2024839 RepID=UPI002B2773C2|nr:hemerythrin domain-containing protein [Marinovum sp.]